MRTKTIAALLLWLAPLAASADIFYDGPTGQTLYVRLRTGASTFKGVAMTEGTSGGLGTYRTTDTAIGIAGISTSSAAAGYPNGYPFTVRSGSASDTANDQIVGSGSFPFNGSVEIAAPANISYWSGIAVATPDTAGYPKVTVKDGTGTGEIDTSSGQVSATGGVGSVDLTPVMDLLDSVIAIAQDAGDSAEDAKDAAEDAQTAAESAQTAATIAATQSTAANTRVQLALNAAAPGAPTGIARTQDLDDIEVVAEATVGNEAADLIAARVNAARGAFYPNRSQVWVLQRTSSGVVVKDSFKPTKKAGETLKLWIDFAGVLGKNEFVQSIDTLTVSGASVTLVTDSDGITGNLVYAKFSGGTASATCTLSGTYTTTSDQHIAVGSTQMSVVP